jgi:MinD-like ATPase involved in chromosome partitioning or flagellar assembly
LWVTSTEFASVRDSIEAMRALTALNYPQDRVRVVVNTLYPDDGVRPSAVQDALQREIFWQVPYEKKVRQGTHLGQPIVVTNPQTVAAKSFTDLATVVSGGRVESGGNRSLRSAFKWRGGSQESGPAVEVAEGSPGA